MALDLHPGYRCWNRRRHTDQPPPPAVGIVRETNTPYAPLEPYCQPCIDHLEELGSAHFLVHYLQPTRQRRPQPDHDDGAWIDGVWYDRATFYRKYAHPAL